MVAASLASSLLLLGAASSVGATPLIGPISAAAGDTLRGTLADSAGKPIAGAVVRLEELGRSTTSSSDGSFRLADVPAGRYTLVVRRVGYAPVAQQIQLPTTAPVTVAMRETTLRLEPVIVTAARGPSDPLNTPLPVEWMEGERLRREHEVSLAQAIDGLPGVRNLSTGEQVGKPIIRGLTGPRVLTLDNGNRLEDYSWSDEDGPSVDSRLAERIEVIRGPASVMYGSEAIGGVINVISDDVPDARGQSSFTRGAAEMYGATNNSEFGGVLRAEGASGAFGWRGTLIGRTAGNFHTPTGNEQTPTGNIFDTGYYTVNGEAAIGVHGERSSGSLRYSRYGGEFGLLDGPPEEADDSEGPLRKLKDDRVQGDGNWLLSNSMRLEVKGQWQRHSLTEVVGDSRVGDEQPIFDLLLNTFSADVLAHHGNGTWLAGTVGLSGLYQDNTTSGVAPLIPDARTGGGALFAFEQATFGKWGFLVGARGDVRHYSTDPNETLQLGAESHTISAFTAHGGVVYRPAEGLALAANVGRSFRAPTLYELYTNGPHLGEDRFEVGIPDAKPEYGFNTDLALKWERSRFRGNIGVYRNQITNYLYIQNTGDSATFIDPESGEEEQLPKYQYIQTQKALLYGVDAGAELEALRFLTLRGRFDYVYGENSTASEPLPLMPPVRGDLEAELHTTRSAGAHYSYLNIGTTVVGNQTRLGPFDEPTSSYALLNMGGGISRMFRGRMYYLDVRVKNVLDKKYSDYLSRYKTFAYEPGTNFIFRLSTGL
jgi:outer membrane receptor protein involved in Fe transport